MTRYFAGIGSRNTPETVLDLIGEVCKELYLRGPRRLTLRSGGAEGADFEFEFNWPGPKEIWVPWAGFGEKWTRENFDNDCIMVDPELAGLAEILASAIHPNWRACSQAARKLHTRNVYQIWGADLNTPVKVVILWAKPDKYKNDAVKGGTNMAYQIARAANIPIYNLYDWLPAIEAGTSSVGTLVSRILEDIG